MLQIGALKLRLPVVQAALSGYSDLVMRRVARAHGAELTLSEAMLDELVLRDASGGPSSLAVPGDDHPVAAQLLGSDAEPLAAAADHLITAGYDAIDINFACPVPKVLRRGRGGYLLSQPHKALEIVERLVAVVDGRRPLTLKLRRGWDASAESARAFWTVLEGALERGVDAVTVHARTVEQRYVGRSDWSLLAEVKRRAAGATVLGSGDLYTPQDVVRMVEQTGVDGVALGRGCIGNPWLFRRAGALLRGEPPPPLPSVPEQGRTIRLHFELAAGLYGDRRAGKRMRKFGIAYSRLHPAAVAVRQAFVCADSGQAWRAVLDTWYVSDRDRAPSASVEAEPDVHVVDVG